MTPLDGTGALQMGAGTVSQRGKEIINHILLSTIRAVISTLTCTSMASNSTSDSECYLAV